MRVFTITGLVSVLVLCAALPFGRQTAASDSPNPLDTALVDSLDASRAIQLTTGRIVEADAALPLPSPGNCAYVFARSALSSADLSSLKNTGMRYMGPVSRRCLAFMREAGHDETETQEILHNIPAITGTAFIEQSDRLTRDVASWLDKDGPLPHPLCVVLWPRTTAGELASVLKPDDGAVISPPTNPQESLDVDCIARLFTTAARLKHIAASPFVSRIEFRYPPQFATAGAVTQASAANLGNAPYSATGSGTKIGQWDAGAVAHNDYAGRVTNVATGATANHATAVCGVMIGNGTGDATAKGYAPQGEVVAHNASLITWDTERRDAKYNHYHVADNHSWGSHNGGYGGYNADALIFDTDSRDLFLMGCESCGNITNATYGQIDNEMGKNIFHAGAVDDGRVVGSFSGRGPTQDGRIKPDIVAVGVDMYMTNFPGGAPWGAGQYTPTTGISGTSFAAPGVTATLALMQQMYISRYSEMRMPPDLCKALLCHAATDLGNTGPDYTHGWGMLNGQAAADLIIADAASPGGRFVRGSLKETETRTYTMTVPAAQTSLKVTLAWIDAFAGATAADSLIHDLDLELVEPGTATVKYPWTLNQASPATAAVSTQKNSRDNLEQVLVNNPVAGDWTIRVKGTSVADPTYDVQGFVLVTSHAVSRTNVTRILDAARPSAPVNIPDGPAGALPVTFNSAATGNVTALRVYLELKHQKRGDIQITLASPANAVTQTIEVSDTSTRKGFHSLYPDIRCQDSDMTAFIGTPANGTWTMTISDVAATNTGSVLSAMLELEAGGGGGAPVLTTITVTPDPITVGPGAAQQFTAVGRDQNGAVMAISPAATWTVTAAGGTITAGGLLTASATNGVYVVTAASGAVSGTADVTISSTPVLTTITVTPSPTTATVSGGTRQFTAVGRDQFGAVIAFTPTWAATGGTIDANGLYTAGVTSGPFTVTATDAVTTIQGTANVTVSAATTTPPPTLGGGGCALTDTHALALLSLVIVFFLTVIAQRRRGQQA